SPRDFFDLFFRVLFRIEANAALRSTKRHVNDGALVRHQGSQCHDLILIHQLAVSYAAFDRLFVLAVLSAPSLENFILVAAEPDRELEVINAIAGLDLAEKSSMNFQILGRSIELF